MTKKRLAYSVLVSLVIAAGCSTNTVKKPKDGSPDVDTGTDTGGIGGGFTGGSGGGGTGGATGGVGGSTGGVGGGTGGSVVEPSASDAGADALHDGASDAQSDGSADAQPDGGEAGPICMPACTLGDKRCGTGGLQTCESVNGCAAWGTEMACGANRTCTGTGAASACTCTAAPAACTAAGTFCTGNVRSTCELVNGCLVLSATTKTCGTRQTCTGGLPSGDCVCNAAPTGCSAAGTFCPTIGTVGTCAQDADSCFFKSGNDTTCMNGQVCVANGATAACACPATVGTTLGTACTTVGQTVCSGDTVLTCAMNGSSGCKTWLLTTDCAGTSGLTCGTRSGPAACECPAVTDGNFYVDPVAGNDASGATPFPSGAKSPAACRFKTLSKAANIAITNGNKIIAITATVPGVFTQATSIAIAAGVTLTTADAAPTPANYRLEYTGSSGVAVSLANGSAISGFTIANGNTAANMANPSVALGCVAGTVTVNTVVLDGTSSNGLNVFATGLQIGGAPTFSTCTGTFNKVTADGFATGVLVSTSATTAPVLTSTTVMNSASGSVGHRVEAGTVTSTDLLVQPEPGMAAAGLGVVVQATSSIIANFMGSSTSLQNTADDAVQLLAGSSPPQASLTNAVILSPQGATSSGVRVDAGTLTVSGTSSITTPGQFGLNLSGGTITATGLAIAGSGDDGVHVTGGTLNLHKSSINVSHNRNVFMNNGAVLIDDGTTITNAVNDGIEIAPSANDSFTLGGAGGDLVDISTNGGHGISLTGVGSASATVSVQRVTIRNNSLNGISVALTGNANGITFLNSTVSGNHQHGVVVTGAPATTAAGITFDTVEVHSQTGTGSNGRGYWLHGNAASSSDIIATIKNSKIHDNRDTGVLIDEGMGNTTTESLTGDDIHDNNLTGAALSVGGISFATSSTLAAFASNKMHSNGGDQIAFTAKPTAGTNWDINAPGACGAGENQIYCYTLQGAIGLRATAPNPAGAYTIDAREIRWSHTALTAADVVAGANTMVTSTGTCMPAATCP